MNSFDYDKRFTNSILQEFLNQYNMKDENNILIEEIPNDGQFQIMNFGEINIQEYFTENNEKEDINKKNNGK